MENKRGSWGSHFGFLMATVGSAVGLGNIWGFPYKMGKSGGFAFLLVYLILVVIVGVAIMLGELALGRKTGRGAVAAYAALGKKYKVIGYMAVISGFLILSFYNVLGGMVLRYTVGYLISIFGGSGFSAAGTGFFSQLIYNSGSMLLYCGIFTLINCAIVMGGISGGIEKFSKIAMPALVVILVFVVIYVACQSGAIHGYEFMFKPDFEALEGNFFTIFKTAAGQMFFSLSLGMGVMITYGSYLGKEEKLQGSALIIPAADTIMAILAGCAVMPACAAFGVDYGKGPGLLFVSMQSVFSNMGSTGNIIGFLFYFLVLIAAITSSISLLEVCTSFIVDKKIDKGLQPNRKKTIIICALILFVIGLPVALDALGSGSAAFKAPFELLGLSGTSVKVWNDCWLDFYDMLSEGILMPLGALLMSIMFGWIFTTKLVKDECMEGGNSYKYEGFFKICFKFIVPIVMIIVLIAQIQDFFF